MLTYLESDIREIASRLAHIEEKLSSSTILITGASGFLCKYFMAMLAQIAGKYPNRKMRVVAVDNYVTSTKEGMSLTDLGGHVEWIFADAKIASELPDKFDYIIQAAGIASPQHYRAKPLETIYVSVDVTRSLLEKARKDGARLLFFSSSEIYGDPNPSAEIGRAHV